MGNNLVDLTDQMLKGTTKFFKSYNKIFNFVKIETFIFQEANYLEVSIKEVEEVRQVFN